MSECVRRCHFYIFTLTFHLSLLLKSKFFINNRGFADRYKKKRQGSCQWRDPVYYDLLISHEKNKTCSGLHNRIVIGSILEESSTLMWNLQLYIYLPYCGSMSSGTGLWGGGTNALKEKEFFVSSLYSVCFEQNSITNGRCSLNFRTLPECSNYWNSTDEF